MPDLSKRQKGDIGEDIAEKYLVSLGYKIIGRNMTCRYGEIDVVARKKDYLYFVEIKRRVGSAYGLAVASISEAKKKRLRRTAEHLLFTNREWRQLVPFFSVIAIDEDKDGILSPKIEFLPDAF